MRFVTPAISRLRSFFELERVLYRLCRSVFLLTMLTNLRILRLKTLSVFIFAKSFIAIRFSAIREAEYIEENQFASSSR